MRKPFFIPATPAGDPLGTSGARSHMASLDGLRGLAIVGVLVFHVGWFPGGFLGVDLFFAISGYLITGVLLREVSMTGRASLRAFWARRMRRLLPALAVLVLVVAAAVCWIADAELVRSTRSDGPWVVVNLLNWHLIAEGAGYWDRLGVARVFEHLWSISVEEQFYVVWPVVIVLVAVWVRRPGAQEMVVVVLAAVGAVASLVAMILLVDATDTTRVYQGSDSRSFSLLLGALVATEPVRRTFARPRPRTRGLVCLVLVLVLAVIWVCADGTRSSWLFSGGLFVHAALSSVLVGMLAQGGRTAVAAVLGRRPLQWLGRVSYSLYLWHWPVIVLLPLVFPWLTGWLQTAVVLAVALVMAAASYALIENPIRFRAAWARGRSGWAVLVATLAVLLSVWALLPEPSGVRIDLDGL